MSQGQPVSLGFPFLLVLKEKLYGSIARSFLDQIFFLTPNQQCQSTDIDQWPFLILSLSSIGLQVEETLFDLRWPTVVQQQQRLFNGLRSGTTRVGRYQKKHSPTHTHPDHRASFIIFLHLQRSMASSLFNLRA